MTNPKPGTATPRKHHHSDTTSPYRQHTRAIYNALREFLPYTTYRCAYCELKEC